MEMSEVMHMTGVMEIMEMMDLMDMMFTKDAELFWDCQCTENAWISVVYILQINLCSSHWGHKWHET